MVVKYCETNLSESGCHHFLSRGIKPDRASRVITFHESQMSKLIMSCIVDRALAICGTRYIVYCSRLLITQPIAINIDLKSRKIRVVATL